MGMLEKQEKDYSDGRTKQAFKDECDINRLLSRAQRTGALSHLEQFGGVYGDFSDFDFHEAQNQLAKAREIFDALPSEIRREFANDPGQFFEFANRDENVGKLQELFPELAEPGTQRVVVTRTAETEKPVTPTDPKPVAEDPKPVE